MNRREQLKQLSSDELILGSDLALDNGKELLKAAELSALHGLFGPANSLVILSIEESVKSLVLCFYSFPGVERSDIFYKVFFEHKSKHKIWVWIELLDILIETFSKSISEVKALEEQGKVKTDKCGSLLVQKILLVMKSWLENASNPLQEINSWRMSANSKKNMGFYVDYSNQSWISPSNTTSEEYLESKKYAEKFIYFLEEFKKIGVDEFNRNKEKFYKGNENNL